MFSLAEDLQTDGGGRETAPGSLNPPDRRRAAGFSPRSAPFCPKPLEGLEGGRFSSLDSGRARALLSPG